MAQAAAFSRIALPNQVVLVNGNVGLVCRLPDGRLFSVIGFTIAGGKVVQMDILADPDRLVKMNGREVFKFATRVLVSSAEAVLRQCGESVEDVDVYVPHQANVRIIEHATKKLGIPSDRVVVNVDRYGNTSSGSIPLALADAQADGRLRPGSLVLMTGMGAGLTWGSALMRWTEG